MADAKFTTSDPNLIAFLRMKGVDIGTIVRDPNRSNRMRATMCLPEQAGVDYEIEFRNSDYRVFSDLQRDTMDLLKRR